MANSHTDRDIYNEALAVIAGKHGNDEARRKSLELAGFDYDLVQNMVNRIIVEGYKMPLDALVVELDLQKYGELHLKLMNGGNK